MRKWAFFIGALLALIVAERSQAQFTLTTNNGVITIKAYTGFGPAAVIPSTTNGLPVANIGTGAFSNINFLASVTIPGSVTNIGTNAFSLCTALTNVSLSLGLSNINAGAFSGCGKLTNFTVPNSVLNIGSNAFASCTNLTNMVLGTGLTNIGNSAFAFCYKLPDIIMPDSVLSLGTNTFFTCTNLTNVTLGTGALIIGNFTFLSCSNLGTVTIPNSVTSIGVGTFEFCKSLTNITFGSNVVSIGNSAFQSCTTLASVTTPGKLASIGNSVFQSCTNLTNIYIGQSVSSISSSAFTSCSKLQAFTVDPLNTTYASQGGVLFDKAMSTLVMFPLGLSGPYTVPNGVTDIGNGAFSSGKIASITFSSSVVNISTSAFQHCTSLTDVTFTSSLVSVGDNAFNQCYSLANVALPGSLASLGSLAFNQCALTNITVPASLTNMGVAPFMLCYGLTDMEVDPANPAYTSVDGVIYDKAMTTVFEFPSGRGGGYAILPGVTDVGNAAFMFCDSLTAVTVPDSVTNIEVNAFNGCYSLSTVILGRGLLNIGDYAFQSCTAINRITIPSSVTNIGVNAFQDCEFLYGMFFQGNEPAIPGSFLFSPTTIYYLPGTTGWSSSVAGVNAMLWNPLIQTAVMQNGQFAFNITGTSNIPVVLEGCTDLTGHSWSTLTNISLTNGLFYFSELAQTNGSRFYRVRSP